jgi:hypothetical protein
MIVCVLNQLGGHWLLYDALNCSITLSLKMREEARIQPTFDPLVDDDRRISLELSLLASNIKKEVDGIFYSFFTFLKSYEKKKFITLFLIWSLSRIQMNHLQQRHRRGHCCQRQLKTHSHNSL